MGDCSRHFEDLRVIRYGARTSREGRRDECETNNMFVSSGKFRLHFGGGASTFRGT
jgi:hypothetical protein